uniref:Uncharacterized protein n=1 Tax=Rhipicephalus zambeziensis TaxID=60191 RepID=A0A224YHG4_9ACAR
MDLQCYWHQDGYSVTELARHLQYINTSYQFAFHACTFISALHLTLRSPKNALCTRMAIYFQMALLVRYYNANRLHLHDYSQTVCTGTLPCFILEC